jgi:hypothetical protein
MEMPARVLIKRDLRKAQRPTSLGGVSLWTRLHFRPLTGPLLTFLSHRITAVQYVTSGLSPRRVETVFQTTLHHSGGYLQVETLNVDLHLQP